MTSPRPWEAQEGLRPWEQPQTLFNRTVAVTRNARLPAAGLGGVSELRIATETAVLGVITYAGANNFTFVSLTGVPAEIGPDSTSRDIGSSLPSAARRLDWRIAIQANYAALGTITERDIVTDDLGKRYQVSAATWTFQGYNLRVSLLEN